MKAIVWFVSGWALLSATLRRRRDFDRTPVASEPSSNQDIERRYYRLAIVMPILTGFIVALITTPLVLWTESRIARVEASLRHQSGNWENRRQLADGLVRSTYDLILLGEELLIVSGLDFPEAQRVASYKDFNEAQKDWKVELRVFQTTENYFTAPEFQHDIYLMDKLSNLDDLVSKYLACVEGVIRSLRQGYCLDLIGEDVDTELELITSRLYLREQAELSEMSTQN